MALSFDHPPVLAVCTAVKAAGGRAYLVGGTVRDRLMGSTADARDYDLEVYGLDGAALRAVLQNFGRVNTVGEAFTVYKIGDIDVSIPRRDSKTGDGHKGFTVVGDPTMTIEEAARRRDFTINAILVDPLSGEILDPYGGRADLQARRLRAVDAATFVEDSLRVLRGMQFAARFEFTIDPATVALCRSIPLDDLPSERIWGEFEKLLLRARRPSIGMQAGLELGVMEKLFPDFQALVGCPQEPAWHPEGDVWVHTLQAIDLAAQFIDDLPMPKQVAVMLGTLCHDLGKPPTTKVLDGRIRSLDHEAAGIPPTERVLDRLNIHTMDGYDVRKQIVALVDNHLKPGVFYKEGAKVGDAAFRRLALKCEIDLLYRVAKADSLGRVAPGAKPPNADAQEWFLSRAKELSVRHEPEKPLLLGRHLLEMGLPPGPKIGEITAKVYEFQLDGRVRTLDDARAEAKRLLGR
ncbi:MAG TPA: polynucleotide adenylyltransferase [Planctomycetota bacterium]|nr:polynucleotide adenylyltransferase [Planctomycetota bacterium]